MSVASQSHLYCNVHIAEPYSVDAEFCANASEVIAILGASGAGKSTLLKSLAGIATTAKGDIRCNHNIWLNSKIQLSPPTTFCWLCTTTLWIV